MVVVNSPSLRVTRHRFIGTQSGSRTIILHICLGIRKTTSSSPPLEDEAIRASMLSIKRAQVLILNLKPADDAVS